MIKRRVNGTVGYIGYRLVRTLVDLIMQYAVYFQHGCRHVDGTKSNAEFEVDKGEALPGSLTDRVILSRRYLSFRFVAPQNPRKNAVFTIAVAAYMEHLRI